MIKNQTPMLGFCAFSGTGKTTLLTSLIPVLNKNGLKIGLIKHAHHHFEIDHPGKDSYELRKAGAREMIVASAKRWALVHESPEREDEPTLNELLPNLSLKDLDLILVEGFKNEPLSKIELHRPSMGRPLLYPNDTDIIALATDRPINIPKKLPILDLNNVNQIAYFIERSFLKQKL